jgi:predicted AAA+ superfamily ATPase
LAFQIGNQVSSNELAQICKVDSKTIDKYISLLEKSYIIFRLNSYAKNVRNELKKSKKIYFYDLGIRNALINNFSQIENRQDLGALWENFLISERLKQNQYTEKWRNTYFWRNTEQNEIDYIEEYNDQLYAYEFKWNPSAKVSISKSFVKGYPDALVKVIHKDNFDEFLID